MLSVVLPFVDEFIEMLADGIRTQCPGRDLSRTQRTWLKFCLMGILITNSLNWRAFERAGLGLYRVGALSWMFRRSGIWWDGLLRVSVELVLRRYGIHEGTLVGDDLDRQRAKRTHRIWKAHTLFDKKTGGYWNGQCLVFLLLVTAKVTLPVGVRFFQPDPKRVAWRQEDTRLRQRKVKKRDRPKAPAADPAFPSKTALFLDLIQDFRAHHPTIQVKAVLIDAAFCTRTVLDDASRMGGQCQVMSQLRRNQTILFRNRIWSVEDYFRAYPGVPQRIRIRGGQEVTAVVGSARLYVRAHGQKRFVIALRYPGETDDRYRVATDMSWRTLDIVQTFTLRWLVEVFFEDWTLYEGWRQMAKQPGEEGSRRSLTLSLLCDHALLLHPEQRALLDHNLPACTVGSLRQRIQGDTLLAFVRSVATAENVADRLAQLADQVRTWFPLAPSGKHMSGRDLGRQDPTPALRYRALDACAG